MQGGRVVTVVADLAGEVVAELIEESAGLRSCAVIDEHGEVLAATDERAWAPQAERLWRAAADPAASDPAYVHVAIDAGELFAVRDERFTVLGIADRFSLASLILCDLRAALRRLEPGPA